MTSIVTASIKASLSWTCVDGANPLAGKNLSGAYPIAASGTVVLAAGSGTGQIDAQYINRITVTASSSTTLDLTAVTDPADNAPVFVRVIGLIVYNNDTHGNKVTVGGGTNPVPINAGGAQDIWPGVTPYIFSKNDATGIAVTPSTGMNLKFTNASANDITLDVFIFGRKE